MMNKIWHKFFLLAVLSFMPMLSQAFCTTTSSFGTGTFTQQAYPGGVRLVLTTSAMLTGTMNCFISPTALTPAGSINGEPTVVKKNGVTVDFSKVKVSVVSSIISNCTIQDQGSSKINLISQGGSGCAGQTVNLRIEYLLEGTSTTSADVDFFIPKISSVADRDQPSTTSTASFAVVKVPKSTNPTCNFLIDPPNITLEPIKLSDIANLNAGAALEASQKKINLTVNCAANALSANATFTPQFSPTKSAILTGSSHVALNDGTDNGVGFKLFDPSGSAIAFKTPLSAFPQSFFTFTPTQRTLTKAYTIRYAKTSTAVKAGPVTSSITITFSIL